MKTLACYSIKGGVGKTASSVNLAYLAAQAGYRTLLIDLDSQGASSFYFRVRPSKKNWGKRFFKTYEQLLKQIKASDFDRLDIIPAHESFRHFDAMLSDQGKREQRLKRVLKGLKKEYDLIILDCPPTLSYLSEAVFHAVNMILVPVIPTTLSERTFEQLQDFFHRNDLPDRMVYPFFSMVQRQKHLHKSTIERLQDTTPRLLEAQIPFSTDIEKMGEHRSPISCFAPRSPGGQAYEALWQEIARKLEKL
ncbi:ParA family protein [Oceanospirillum linum]|uniref:Cobyrinic acid a,c-diamide synthase n=1 Tax=Oceanospirillum linum TaxID=966 RepID=A0A1T1HAG1_OCELI|nr:AAA family ATPase [Oceanospirillum linum]OOV86766.1 cobyrinic acid a,c-diamide synthase [Oceanospirillum linum]SEG23106.1 Cellulose biosynthesis protein BcsQ [Oleiphilus messinensis]SMP25511.1 Cellulose biosynthesis protein BcsQ [Oceanospirillum linum]